MVSILIPKGDVPEIQKRVENFRMLEKEVRELVKIEFKIKKNRKNNH